MINTVYPNLMKKFDKKIGRGWWVNAVNEQFFSRLSADEADRCQVSRPLPGLQ
jgi:hypothetical protein